MAASPPRERAASSQPIVFASSPDAVGGWLADLGGSPVVAVDTETSGWDPHVDRLRLVQVAAGPGRPVLVVDAERCDPRVLRPLLAAPEVLKVFHHGAFDLRFLRMAGVEVTRVADTMLAEQLLDGGAATAPGWWSLARIAEFRLGMRLDKSVRAGFAAGGPLTDEQVRYAADDATATWEVFARQRGELAGHGLNQVARLEFAAMPVLADLQLRGVGFDADRWLHTLGRLEGELPQLESAVQAALVCEDSPRDLFGPTPVKLDSPEQIKAALGRLGVHLEQTHERALRDHRGHPAVDALLAYRQVSKVTGNWGGDWARRVVHARTGRVHADWRQIVGAGRISCREPNLTQVPRDVRYRSCFVAPPGRALVVADYSQQELRILAAVSGDEALREVFLRGGDLHRATAAMAFGIPEESVDPARRSAAKALNFGLMYGMGARGFARSTGMTPERAAEVMGRYFATFPRVSAWLREAEATGRRTGRVRTPLGRIRVLDDDEGGTMARNAPIQGAGADMVKLALAEVHRRMGHGGPSADGLVLVVHDELVVEAAADAADEAAARVVEGMAAAAGRVLGDVPSSVDVAVRPRWGPEP